MQTYPIRYQDSVDLEGDDDDIITLLNPPEQRMLQSILNNVESNPAIWIEDYLEQDTDIVDAFLAALMIKLMGTNVSEFKFDRKVFFPDTNDGVIGTISWSGLSTIAYAGLWVLSTAQGNGLLFDNIWLNPGTYVFRVKARKGNSMGKVHLFIDSVDKVQIDLYNATTIEVAMYQSSSFTLTTSARYRDLLFQVWTKNASSSNYNLQFQWFELIRTGD